MIVLVARVWYFFNIDFLLKYWGFTATFYFSSCFGAILFFPAVELFLVMHVSLPQCQISCRGREKPDEGDSLFALPQLGTRLQFQLGWADKEQCVDSEGEMALEITWHFISHTWINSYGAIWISHPLFRQVLVFPPLTAIAFSRRGRLSAVP